MSRGTHETSRSYHYGKSMDSSSSSRAYGSSLDPVRNSREYGNNVDISGRSRYNHSLEVPGSSYETSRGSRSFGDQEITGGQRVYRNTIDGTRGVKEYTSPEISRRSHQYGNANHSSEYVSDGYKLPRAAKKGYESRNGSAIPYEPPVDYDSDPAPPRGSYYRDTSGSGYISNDDRTVSEYTMEIERMPMSDYGRTPDFRSPSEFRSESRASYVSRDDRPVSEYSLKVAHIPPQRNNTYLAAPSEYSYRSAKTDRSARTERSARTDRSGKSYRSERSVAPSIPMSDNASVKTKTSRFGKVEVETMSAPHPLCPNTKGMCCLMILLNLALLLITLGFIVIFNLHKPPFVWYLGICMVIFGFLTLFGTLIYCVFVCRERPPSSHSNGDLYWTHHWRKSFTTPEIHYTNSQHRYFPTGEKNYTPSVHSNGSQHQPYYTHGEKISIHSAQSNGTRR